MLICHHFWGLVVVFIIVRMPVRRWPSSKGFPSPQPYRGWVWWRWAVTDTRPPLSSKDPRRWWQASAEQRPVWHFSLHATFVAVVLFFQSNTFKSFLWTAHPVVFTVPSQFSGKLSNFSSEGLRVLALAYKPLDANADFKTIERWEPTPACLWHKKLPHRLGHLRRCSTRCQIGLVSIRMGSKPVGSVNWKDTKEMQISCISTGLKQIKSARFVWRWQQGLATYHNMAVVKNVTNRTLQTVS